MLLTLLDKRMSFLFLFYSVVFFSWNSLKFFWALFLLSLDCIGGKGWKLLLTHLIFDLLFTKIPPFYTCHIKNLRPDNIFFIKKNHKQHKNALKCSHFSKFFTIFKQIKKHKILTIKKPQAHREIGDYRHENLPYSSYLPFPFSYIHNFS